MDKWWSCCQTEIKFDLLGNTHVCDECPHINKCKTSKQEEIKEALKVLEWKNQPKDRNNDPREYFIPHK